MLPASRHRVNAARAWSGDAPASPQAGVITACSGHVSSGSPSRRHSRMTRSAACLASALPSPGPVGPVVPASGAGTARPAQGPTGPGDGSAEARQAAERVIRLWHRLGLPLETCPDQAVITPACGLAGASPGQARAALTRCREAGSMLAELIEETGDEPR